MAFPRRSKAAPVRIQQFGELIRAVSAYALTARRSNRSDMTASALSRDKLRGAPAIVQRILLRPRRYSIVATNRSAVPSRVDMKYSLQPSRDTCGEASAPPALT